MRFFLIGLMLFSTSIFAEAVLKAAPKYDPWQKVKTRKHVDVFKKDVQGTSIVAFRGIGEINAPIEKVVSVIYDVRLMKDWMSDFKEARVLTRKGPCYKIEYHRTNAPWPISDRDFVYFVKANVNNKAGRVDLIISATTHKTAPAVEDVVRGELSHSRYLIERIGPNKTRLLVEIQADPKGMVPKWVVNLFQSVWPSNTIDGIREIAEAPGYQVHPDIVGVIGPRANKNKVVKGCSARSSLGKVGSL